MAVTQHDDAVEIDGSQDITQLKVQGHSTQTAPLQQWENNGGDVVAEVHDDGRLQVGDEPGTPDALLEAHRDDALTSGQIAQTNRGIHTSGHLTDEGGNANMNIEWSVHDVTLDGDNTDLAKVAALRAGVVKQGNGVVDEAVGLEVTDITGATDNYAIKTGQGIVHFGDHIELPISTSDPTDDPDTNDLKIYPKLDGSIPRLYAKDEQGLVHVLGGQADTLIAPDLADFSWVNQGTATANQTGSTIHLQDSPQSSINIRLLKKSIPSTPYTITVRMNYLIWEVSFYQAGLAWRESSSGKLVTISPANNTTHGFSLLLSRYNSATNWASNIHGKGIPLPIPWWRLEDDGINRKTSISLDGENWILFNSISRTDWMTADEVGFFVKSEQYVVGSDYNDIALQILSWEEA